MIVINDLNAIAWHLEQGKDNGGIGRSELAVFLRRVAKELEAAQQTVAGDVANRLPFPKCDDCGAVWDEHVCPPHSPRA